MDFQVGESVKGKNFVNVVFIPQSLNDQISLLRLIEAGVGLVAMLEGAELKDGIIQAGLDIPRHSFSQ